MSEHETLRDTFAAAAMAGMMAHGHWPTHDGGAQDAWKAADAMLRERARTNSAEVSSTLRNGAPAGCETVTDHDAAPAARAAELARSPGQSPRGTGDTTREPVAWGVAPGDGLPIWRCSSCEQAQAVVVWLREQRPGTDPQVVPLVDGRDAPPPTLTDAEREALDNAAQWLVAIQSADDPRAGECAATLRGLLARHGGDA